MRIENFEDLKKTGKDCRFYYCYYKNYGIGGIAHDYKEISNIEAFAFCNTPENIRGGFITTDIIQAELWAND